ncbi:unspecified product [Leishmania tarentolae]|uniref:Unspecified product n=1 Tax=Leishmania tarentolae TaxID=5689 RepID=A0A640KSE7_LEITA|nr:unspecified product [Leishmania tarentolae]
MECNMGMVIYATIQLIVFFLVLVATPMGMFFKETEGIPFKGCITLWGLKPSCGSIIYNDSSDVMWMNCTGRRDRFRTAQAFAVISIVVCGAAFVLGLITLWCCSCLRWVCLTLSILGIATLCVVWACMVVTYHQDEGQVCPALKVSFGFSAGLVLLLVAWCLHVINIIFLLIPCRGSIAFYGSKDDFPSTPGEEDTK